MQLSQAEATANIICSVNLDSQYLAWSDDNFYRVSLLGYNQRQKNGRENDCDYQVVAMKVREFLKTYHGPMHQQVAEQLKKLETKIVSKQINGSFEKKEGSFEKKEERMNALDKSNDAGKTILLGGNVVQKEAVTLHIAQTLENHSHMSGNSTEVLPKKIFTPELEAVKDLGPLTADNFSQHAQIALNNFYKKPMPPQDQVTVPNLQGKMVFWKDLSFKEQQEILKANKKGSTSSLFIGTHDPKAIVPRWCHGCMHVSRAAMEIHLMVAMYKKYDPTFALTKQDILLAQYLTIFHDSARQAEGVDVWDDLSAENARDYLAAMGFEEEFVDRAIANLKTKDHRDPSMRGPVARLIQGGDCLDIMRVYGLMSFRNNRLDMFNDLKDKPGFFEDYTDLKNDLYQFIQFTEDSSLKCYLEKHSENYYQDVIGLVGFKEKGIAKFPFISKLLEQEIGKLPKINDQLNSLLTGSH